MQFGRVLRGLGYKVVDSIGKGSFSEVKLAKSRKQPKTVAIKVMNMTHKSPEFVSKLLPNELSILKSVEHLNIIKVHDIHEMPGGQVLVVMEAARMNLNEKISDLRRIPNDQARDWFSQLVSAVEYLHKRNIVHQDLKCANVLLTNEDQIKLADFGFSQFYQGLSESHFCTPEYAAPEIRACMRYDPKKSDVWSLGVILYHMVTGKMPFHIDIHFLKGLQVPLYFPFHITLDKQCQALITEMLDYDPSARPSITEVAKHPWLQSKKDGDSSETGGLSSSGAGSSLKQNAEDVQQQQLSIKEKDIVFLSACNFRF